MPTTIGETTPVRLQLSRRRGYRLQAHSLATNGLPAVVVRRPTRWGNPFSLSYISFDDPGREGQAVELTRSRGEAVELFERFLDKNPALRADIRRHLKGCNLACTCPLDGEPCHADSLLRIANEGESNLRSTAKNLTADELLAAVWSCDAKANYPGDDGALQWLVWAFDSAGEGPLCICSCDSLTAAEAIVAAKAAYDEEQAFIQAEHEVWPDEAAAEEEEVAL